MAEPLKNQYGPDIPRKIAAMIAKVHKPFNSKAFLKSALAGYDDLELTQRGWQMAHALREHLPDSYPKAVKVLLKSLGSKLEHDDGQMGMASFLYLPHVQFVAEYGLDHFEESMQAQYELTQRFTAEFSIRAYLEHHPKRTLARLKKWAHDESIDVRRLVSEGTRTRLPWASRLPAFQKDPQPVLELLELLKDDPALYVRRSVANNLNDIGKDHPQLLVKTAKRWSKGASADRQWLIRHALRSAVKRGDAGALAILGYGKAQGIEIRKAKVTPAKPKRGAAVTISFELFNSSKSTQPLMVDFAVHYVKANGKTSPKVFKLKSLELAAGKSAAVSKKVSLKEMTTRKHYPGRHLVDVIVNGESSQIGFFDLK